jgi:aspartate beta-hydroxylase
MGFLYDSAADVMRRIYDSRIEGPPVLDMETEFPAGERFRAAWRDIRAEAAEVAKKLDMVPRFHEIMREQSPISSPGERAWRMFIVKAYGVEVPAKAALCPTLARLASAAPEVLSASFSFLEPGGHIPPHRGPFRGVLRFYMALSMPVRSDGRPGAVLKIAGVEHRLTEGEYLLWDDTFEHEVWNESDGLRCVLLLDVWRPGMPIDMRLLSKTLIGVVQLGMRVRGFA